MSYNFCVQKQKLTKKQTFDQINNWWSFSNFCVNKQKLTNKQTNYIFIIWYTVDYQLFNSIIWSNVDLQIIKCWLCSDHSCISVDLQIMKCWSCSDHSCICVYTKQTNKLIIFFSNLINSWSTVDLQINNCWSFSDNFCVQKQKLTNKQTHYIFIICYTVDYQLFNSWLLFDQLLIFK